MSITNVDRVGGFVVGSEYNYDASLFGKSIYFAPNTKQIIIDNIKYIPKKLSELTDDKGFILSSLLGATNGIATLDNSGKVLTSQLPSYVDDVLEYSAKTSFPSTGESGKIYVALDTNLTYRWSGSAYVEISKSLSLGTSSSTAYRGDWGAKNSTNISTLQSYFDSGIANEANKVTHSLTVGSKTFDGSVNISLTKSDIGLGNVENTALSTWKGTSNITTLGTITSGVWNGSKIANSYLANSSITISGESVSLGGSITQSALRTALGLGSNAYSSIAYLPLAGGTLTGLLTANAGVKTNKLSINASSTTAHITADDTTNAYINIPLSGVDKIMMLWNSQTLQVRPGLAMDGLVSLGSSDSKWKEVCTNLLKIGDATLSWDSANGCVRIDKGLASDSFVSAKGTFFETRTVYECVAQFGIYWQDSWIIQTYNSINLTCFGTLTNATFPNADIEVYNPPSGSQFIIYCDAFKNAKVNDVEIFFMGFENEQPTKTVDLIPSSISGNALYCRINYDGDTPDMYSGFKIKVNKNVEYKY